MSSFHNEITKVPEEFLELGLSLKETNYKIYSDLEWLNFCSTRNSDPNNEGLFLPRTLSAHLKHDTPFLRLNFFHEYLGHGSFCESSKIGKRIYRYEQELAEIEKQILGVDELPQNTYFKLDKSNPNFDQYMKLRKEYDDYFLKFHNYYEGFAYWLEYYLAMQCGLEKYYDTKSKSIHSHYVELCESFNDLVSKKGKSALLEKLGF